METERIGRGVSVHRAWQAVLVSDFRADQVLSARGLWLLLPMSPSLCEDRLCSNCSVFSLLPFLSHAASLAPKGSRAGRAPREAGRVTPHPLCGRCEAPGAPPAAARCPLAAAPRSRSAELARAVPDPPRLRLIFSSLHPQCSLNGSFICLATFHVQT